MLAMRVVLSVILLIALSTIAASNSHILRNGEVHVGIANCVLQLTAKYFVEKKALSGSIVIININSYASTTQQTLLKTIHDGTQYSVMVKDSAFRHLNASHFPEKAKNYMMILETRDELNQNIHQLNKLPTWNPHAKVVVYIEKNNTVDGDQLVMGIINELREYKVLRTTVLVHFPDTTELKAYTWRPYSDTNCGGLCEDIYLLDTCRSSGTEQNSPSEPMFPYNMKRCPLTVYTVVSEPYVMPPTMRKPESIYNDEYLFELGVEVNLMKIIAHFTNMTLVIRMSNVSADWGYIHKDGNATGLFARLRHDEVDVIIGNMEVNRVIRKWFDPSSTYMQDEITWCVPKAGAAPTWSNLITIFKWTTWITTAFAIFLISSILHWCKYRENRRLTKWPTKSILMTLGMVLGWGALFKPKAHSFRILLLSWLLFSININTAYQSFLRSFLIHPKFEKQIQTESEIVKSKLNLGGKVSLRDFFDSVDPVPQAIYTKWEDCTSLKECVRQTGESRTFALAGSKRQIEYHHQKLGKGSTLLYCFQESNIIYKYGVVVLTRKYFPMIARFNEIIRRVSENGLIWKWNNELFLHGSVTIQNSNEIPLGMDHMLGAFLFLIFGLGISFIVCVLEVFYGGYIKLFHAIQNIYYKRRFLN